MAQIKERRRVFLLTAQMTGGRRRRHEVSLTDSPVVEGLQPEMSDGVDVSGYIKGVTAIIVPLRGAAKEGAPQ